MEPRATICIQIEFVFSNCVFYLRLSKNLLLPCSKFPTDWGLEIANKGNFTFYINASWWLWQTLWVTRSFLHLMAAKFDPMQKNKNCQILLCIQRSRNTTKQERFPTEREGRNAADLSCSAWLSCETEGDWRWKAAKKEKRKKEKEKVMTVNDG